MNTSARPGEYAYLPLHLTSFWIWYSKRQVSLMNSMTERSNRVQTVGGLTCAIPSVTRNISLAYFTLDPVSIKRLSFCIWNLFYPRLVAKANLISSSWAKYESVIVTTTEIDHSFVFRTIETLKRFVHASLLSRPDKFVPLVWQSRNGWRSSLMTDIQLAKCA